MSQRITVDDFFTGLFAGLAIRGHRVFALRDPRFDEAVVAAFQELRDRADTLNLQIPFRILLHPIHGDSTVIRDSLSRAAQRNIVSLDNPEYQDVRLKITKSSAEPYFQRLPADPGLYGLLADRFLSSYYSTKQADQA